MSDVSFLKKQKKKKKKVSDRLAAIEKSLQAIEEQKIDFQKRVEEMEKKRSSRSRMREEQMVWTCLLLVLCFHGWKKSLQKRREEEKKKEQDEYAQFQAEQKRKLEERQRARDIKNKAAKGEFLVPCVFSLHEQKFGGN
jgi:hypothetical protein